MNLRNDLKVDLIDTMGDWTDVVKSARYSTTMNLKDRDKDLKLLRRLWRDQHLSPFEMVETVWHFEAPIFVNRHMVRHRTWSWNEFSQRYSESKLEFYVPSGLSVDALGCMESALFDASESYQELIDYGVSKETARMVLPLSTYTYFRGKVNFRNLIAFLKLRTAEDVQPETRHIALQMVDLLRERLPELMEVCWDEGK